ncbi:MAG: KpsF/GutQ family sugar-phosphate isomerase [Acidobacteriota bacterium]
MSEIEAAALETARRVLEAEAAAIQALLPRLGPEFTAAVGAIAGSSGRVAFCGLGKSGLIGRKLAATFSSTGTPAFFLHPVEAVHGDLGGVVPGDTAVLISHGGENEELTRLLPLLRDMTSRMIGLTSPDTTLARAVDFFLDISVPAEACPLGLAPTASSTATLALGDALAMAVMEQKGFSAEQFSRFHPGGKLGARFLRVRDVMHSGHELPEVRPDTKIRDVIQEISAKRLGMTTVLSEDGKLLGVITDGDLRRLLERVDMPLDLTADSVMSRQPRTVAPELLAAKARELMEWPRKITSLVVVEDDGRPLGIVHFHDLVRLPR